MKYKVIIHSGSFEKHFIFNSAAEATTFAEMCVSSNVPTGIEIDDSLEFSVSIVIEKEED